MYKLRSEPVETPNVIYTRTRYLFVFTESRRREIEYVRHLQSNVKLSLFSRRGHKVRTC